MNDVMAHPGGCTVHETAQLKFFVSGARCMAVQDVGGHFHHDHYGVDERAGLCFTRGRDGGFHYLRISILGGHAHVGPVTESRPASRRELAELWAAARESDAGLALLQWTRRHCPAAA